jgi:hypothetical protein
MNKRFLITLAFIGMFAFIASPALVRAAGNDAPPPGPPCGGHPHVPPFLAEKYDANHDGKLSDAEAKAAREAFLKQYDTDKDGKLSFEEMKAVHADAGKAFFAKADTNNNGVLSPDEFNAAWAKFPLGPMGPRGHHKGWFGGWFKGGKDMPCKQ